MSHLVTTPRITAGLHVSAAALHRMPHAVLDYLEILPADNAAHFKVFDANRLDLQIRASGGGGRTLESLRTLAAPAPLWLHCGGSLLLQMDGAEEIDWSEAATRYFSAIGIKKEQPGELITNLCSALERRHGGLKWRPPDFLLSSPGDPACARLTIVDAAATRIDGLCFLTVFVRCRLDSEQLSELAAANHRVSDFNSEGLNYCCPAISLKTQIFAGCLKEAVLAARSD